MRSTANLLLVAACASSLLATTCYNERKKMTGPAAVIRPSDRVARMRLGRPHFEDAVRLLDALPPGRLAFVPADIESFTYPLFGAHLDRPVTIVHAGRLLRPLTPADLPDVEYVFFNGGAQSFLLDGAPAGPPWPWFGAADLRPLQEALRASGSDWQVVLESGGVGDAVLLFARTSRIGASAIERATRGAALAHERPGRNGM